MGEDDCRLNGVQRDNNVDAPGEQSDDKFFCLWISKCVTPSVFKTWTVGEPCFIFDAIFSNMEKVAL